MRTLKSVLGISLIAIMTMVTFSSCSDTEEVENNCYFTFGVEDYSYVGSSTTEKAKIDQYMSDLYNTYLAALGMSNGNTLLITGDYSSVSTAMKSKFESVTIPTAPAVKDFTYTFKYVLSGADLKKSRDAGNTVITSRTFTNK